MELKQEPKNEANTRDNRESKNLANSVWADATTPEVNAEESALFRTNSMTKFGTAYVRASLPHPDCHGGMIRE